MLAAGKDLFLEVFTVTQTLGPVPDVVEAAQADLG